MDLTVLSLLHHCRHGPPSQGHNQKRMCTGILNHWSPSFYHADLSHPYVHHPSSRQDAEKHRWEIYHHHIPLSSPRDGPMLVLQKGQPTASVLGTGSDADLGEMKLQQKNEKSFTSHHHLVCTSGKGGEEMRFFSLHWDYVMGTQGEEGLEGHSCPGQTTSTKTPGHKVTKCLQAGACCTT